MFQQNGRYFADDIAKYKTISIEMCSKESTTQSAGINLNPSMDKRTHEQ